MNNLLFFYISISIFITSIQGIQGFLKNKSPKRLYNKVIGEKLYRKPWITWIGLEEVHK